MADLTGGGDPEDLVMGRVMAGITAYGAHPALVCEGRRLSYAELSAEANRLAHGLRRLGLAPGDRFAFLLPNGTRIVSCYLACSTSGIVGVPLANRTTPQELVHQIDDSGAVAVLYASEWGRTIADLRDCLAGVRWWITEGEAGGGLSYSDVVRDASAEQPGTRLAGSDPFCLMYTGGTTGAAKAVIQTQQMWAACVRDTVEQLHIGPTDRHVAVLPLTHAAWFTVAAHLSVGATTHILRRWDPTAVLELVERERLTKLHLIPTLLGDLLAAVERTRHDLSSVGLLSLAGAPIPREMYRRARAAFGDVIGNIYGMTEAAGPVTYLMPPEMNESRLQSAGRVGRYVGLVIDDGAGGAADTGATGEILLRGPQLTPGYHGRAQTSAASAVRGGWFHTGDVGRLDEQGFLYVVDRLKDMIKTGGMNVYPHEVEQVLYRHPAVVEAAVIGVPDVRWMETVVAVVALAENADCTAADLEQVCRSALPGFKVPTAIHVVDALPRTSFGKFDKRALQQRFGPPAGADG